MMKNENDIEIQKELDAEEEALGNGKPEKQSVHYGEEGYNEYMNELDDEDCQDITWREVCTTCFSCRGKTAKDYALMFGYFVGILFFLYWFIFSLELLGTGAKTLTGCSAAGLFGGNTNPVAAVIVGMLVTVLLQSSSTTTSIIVSLVGSNAIEVQAAIYMVMGANIGTSVTNTIVAMGQLGNGDELERAFAGATVHDMFNFLVVIILLIVEVITGYLYWLTEAITKNYVPEGSGKKGKGIKTIISPILDLLIINNKKVINDVATEKVPSCDVYYPTQCNPSGERTYQACVTNGRVGLITCSKKTNICPAFFKEGATQRDDTVSGGFCLVLGIIILMMCLAGLVTVLKKCLMGASTRVLRKATNVNGYIAILIGCALTIAVQSSSVTTSVFTPLVGVGLVTVESMFPFTLGANIGTTVTGIMAAGVANTSDAMQVALAHFFFNITGILIFYPVPFMRRIPISAAKGLGTATRWWRGFPILYIAVAFFLIPLILLGISSLFANPNPGSKAFGALIVIGVVLFLVKFFWWWFRQDGKAKTKVKFERRQHRKDVMTAIPDEWLPMKEDIKRLKEHTGLPVEEEGLEKEGDDNDNKTGHNTIAMDDDSPDVDASEDEAEDEVGA